MQTKETTKKHISELAAQFLSETDKKRLADLKKEIFLQITGCPFSGTKPELVRKSLAVWGYDLDKYILGEETKDMIQLSLIGLVTLIDLSDLPAEGI